MPCSDWSGIKATYSILRDLLLTYLFLLCSKGAVSYGGSHYGPGMGPVLLNYLGCTGVEGNLTDCSHSAFGVVSSACRTHLYDASVFCPTGIDNSLYNAYTMAFKHTCPDHCPIVFLG